MSRLIATVVATAAATLTLILTLTVGVGPAAAKQGCGTIKSASIYPRAKITAIRGVSCKKAVRVARAYDHTGRQPGKWKCALGHGGRNLFSCGYGGSSGSIQDFPHALGAKGVGEPD
jgi:hypothetical protein